MKGNIKQWWLCLYYNRWQIWHIECQIKNS